MINKKLLLSLTLIIILFSIIGTVNATQITMDVDSKHIIGSGSVNPQLNPEESINVVYVICEREMNYGQDKYIIQEYPVSIQDYCKIQVGQRVTLEVPDSRFDFCNVVKIE